ncbi:uncharacterized protein LOC116159120 [Photinus pyralis]|uniref:uncharacterized protein LOC116159120 n=1 Tax=Photinus pyralis TaxID=7054 RepID=UPI001267392C|nr:uncharacterized protein LOC116159120 [Photinus pyralis]
MTNVVRTSVKKRRRTIVEKPFYRDIILLQSSKINSTLKGLQKSKAYEEGFAFSNAKFNSNWSYEEIVASIKDLFQHILDGQDFELLVPMSGHLVRLNLPPGVECDGRAIKSRFYQKVIYVRPFVPLLRMGNSEVTPTTDDEYNDNNNNLDEFQEYPEDMHGAPSPNPDGNESIIAENHNIEEIAATSKEGCESQISLTILLKGLNEQVTEESVTSFNVYRNDIFTCCLRALKRSSFSVFNKISVKFSDIEGLSEGAVDAGGPTREMFRLVLNFVKDSRMFFGLDKKYMRLDLDAMNKRHYYAAGQLIALSFIHVGNGPKFFSESFYSILYDDIGNGFPNIDDIEDLHIRETLHKLSRITELSTLQSILEDPLFTVAGCDVIALINI